MSGYPICVAIPTIDFDEAVHNAQAAESLASYIEFRLDYDPQIRTRTGKDFVKLVNSVKIPVIFTLRQTKEGGVSNLEEEERRKILLKLFATKPAFIDLEASLNPEFLNHSYSLGQTNGVGIIYSYHDFTSTPPIGECRNIFKRFLKVCTGLQTPDSKIPSVIKLIFTAQRSEDNTTSMHLLNEIVSKNIPAICFCMGEIGIPSRVKSLINGAFLTFASIGKNTAPGQISIQEMIKKIKREIDQ